MPHRLLTTLLAVLLAVSASCKMDGRAFGPQDEGGRFLIIAVKADAAQLDQAVVQTIEIMRKRCEQLNIYCKAERVAGDKSDRIKLYISSPKEDPERLKGVILSQGLELRAVVSTPGPAPLQSYYSQKDAAEVAGADKDVMPYDEMTSAGGGGRKYVVVERTPIVSGHDIIDAKAVNSRYGPNEYDVTFKLNPSGARRLGEWTGTHLEHYMAVVLNKQIRSVAMVKGQIFDEGVISGRFTKEQAEDAALVLKSGNLPAPIEALEEGTYKP